MNGTHSHLPFFFLLTLLFIVILWLASHLRRALNWQKKHQNLVKQVVTYNTTTTLFEQIGGTEGLAKLIDIIVPNLLAQPTLLPVLSVVDTPGHDTHQQLESALELQFGSILGAPWLYPSKSLTRGAIFQTRTMKEAHKNLTITKAQFELFVSVLASSLLQGGISQAVVNQLAPGLNAMANSIITSV